MSANGSRAATNPWRYATGYNDTATGLTKLGARYYNPTLGRFTQQDISAGIITDPTSLNRFAYTGDNPINLNDPTGRGLLQDFEEIGEKVVEGTLGCVSGLVATDESGTGDFAATFGGPVGAGIANATGCVAGAVIDLIGGGEISEY